MTTGNRHFQWTYCNHVFPHGRKKSTRGYGTVCSGMACALTQTASPKSRELREQQAFSGRNDGWRVWPSEILEAEFPAPKNLTVT